MIGHDLKNVQLCVFEMFRDIVPFGTVIDINNEEGQVIIKKAPKGLVVLPQ